MELIDKMNLAWIKLTAALYSLRSDERGEGGGSSLIAILLTVTMAAFLIFPALLRLTST